MSPDITVESVSAPSIFVIAPSTSIVGKCVCVEKSISSFVLSSSTYRPVPASSLCPKTRGLVRYVRGVPPPDAESILSVVRPPISLILNAFGSASNGTEIP